VDLRLGAGLFESKLSLIELFLDGGRGFSV
jgi:hypothetical protein